MTTFFAMFSGFSLTFTENFLVGVNASDDIRRFSPGERFETDTARFCPIADAAVIQTAKRNPHQGKNGINETLRGPQGKPEYTLNLQNSGDLIPPG